MQPQLNTVDNRTIDSDSVIFMPVNQTERALTDIKDGLKCWPIWLMLAYQDIKLRYRRSVLGPFWLTLSMAITVYAMGFIYSQIFHIDLANYLPYLAAGMLIWTLLATMLTELTDGLQMSENLIKQVKLPYTLYIHRIVSRNMIIFFHNLAVMIPIYLIYHKTANLNANTLFLLPCLLLIYLSASSFGISLSMIGARYRDLSPIIKSLVQLTFFITPVMWMPDALPGNAHYLIDLNPLYAMIALIRAPLLGHPPSFYHVFFVATLTLIGLLTSFIMLIKRRARIIYWL